MCVDSVWTQPPYKDINPPTLPFLIPFKPSQSHKACCFDSLTVWHHISEGRATGVDWQPCIAIVSALCGSSLSSMFSALEQL